MRLRLTFLSLALLSLATFFAGRAVVDRSSTPGRSPQASSASRSATQVQLLEQQVSDHPQDASLLVMVANLYLQRARETGDPTYYALADDASTRALAISSEDVPALVVAASVELARHDFARALELGERARSLNPDVLSVYAVLTDADVELGRYEEAVASAQEMIDRRPDFASYSRASYIRELHGDVAGAIEAMELAAASAALPFDEAWALIIVGDLHLSRGGIDGASRAYSRAALVQPDDPVVLAAQARIAAATGDPALAEALLRRAVELRPLPEYAVALGELLESQGRPAEAAEQYALVRATQRLLAANGVDADIELALFEADHGDDPAAAYELALGAYARRPGILGADAVAWTAFRAGRIAEARHYASDALRLGTRDPRITYHMGVIALAAGDQETAESFLALALEGEALLPPAYAADARAGLVRDMASSAQ